MLKAGDTLFIQWWICKIETQSDLNINFNIIFEQNDENRIIKCSKKFGYVLKYNNKSVIKIIVFK